jgi:chromosome partitioning protein
MRQISTRFTAKNIERIFQLEMSKTSFLSLEARGKIPRAIREKRGQSLYRYWTLADLPKIGSSLGFLQRPTHPQVVSVFSLKGGTGKSTLTFQFARAMALHGIRTLVVGLDAQESVTQTLNQRLSERKDPDNFYGVYDILTERCRATDAIIQSDIETLSYIPETIELSVLDRILRPRLRKEYAIKETVVDPIVESGNYDVILFDCNPAWTETVTGALAASDILVAPMGCDVNSLRAAGIFVDLLGDFTKAMRHNFKKTLLVPTLVESNKLSQQILARYRLNYDDICTVTCIRRTIAVQEANVLGTSLLELGLKLPIYQDFVGVFKEINRAMGISEPHEDAGNSTYSGPRGIGQEARI